VIIKTNAFFPFFALSLLGMEEPRVVEHDGIVDAVAMPGIYVDEDSLRMRRVRNIGDILQHSVRKYFGTDPEVDQWVTKLGGMAAVDEILVGRDALKEYIHDLREIKASTGFAPTVLGDRRLVEGVDSATEYDSYAVTAHRELSNQASYGEIQEDKFSDPSWEGHESNIEVMPFWWKNMYLGKSSYQLASDKKFLARRRFSFKQLETSSPRNNKHVDFRIGGLKPVAMLEHDFFPRFCAMEQEKGWKSLVRGFDNWFLIEDHKEVKDLLDKFYNNPKSLMWFMDPFSYGDQQRLCCGARTGKGHIIWVPLAKDSQKSFDWWRENEDKTREQFYCRALYYGPWIMAFRKARRDGYINVRLFKECPQTGWLSQWGSKDIHYSEWKDRKESLLAKGAKDAYFGKPWKEGVYETKQTQAFAQEPIWADL
jgi:hypothetical protein